MTVFIQQPPPIIKFIYTQLLAGQHADHKSAACQTNSSRDEEIPTRSNLYLM